MRNRAFALLAATLAALAVASAASAHAKLDPPVGVANATQLYTVMVPTEKASATTKVELTPPADFTIWSVAAQPGWKSAVQTEGSGESERVTKVTWSGGSVPEGESALLQFTGMPRKSGSFTFEVRQTYADGSVVDWNGPESSDSPAPVVKAETSLGGGGGGSSTLSIVAVILGGIALLVALAGLATGRGGRALA
jgi:uncharacterized protein YcnI